MLWKNYGKAMEFLFLGSVRTLLLPMPLEAIIIIMIIIIVFGMHQNINGVLNI